jgi:hypothetical protein
MAAPEDEIAANTEDPSHPRPSQAGAGDANGRGDKNEGSDRRLQMRIALIGALATIAAAIVGAIISLHPWSSGSPSSSGSRTSSGTSTVQAGVSSGFAALAGHVFVKYEDGTDASAQVSGLITNAASGEVAGLYAQQFPFTSPPALVNSTALSLSGTTAPYAFQVTPTLATRYTVKVFRNSSAKTPFTSSVTKTIYVIMDQPGTNTVHCTVSGCRSTEVVTVQVPASALRTQISEHIYTYFAVNNGTDATPETLQLGAGNPTVGRSQQISTDEYQFSLTYSFSNVTGSYEAGWRHCTKSVETKDGIGLPGGGNYGCGGQTVQDSATYIG